MANLYELTQTAAYLQELLESGDIDEQVFLDTMESIGAENKLENVCKMIRNLESRAAACKAEKDAFAEKEKVARNGVQRLKESLLAYLQTTSSKKVTAGLFTVSLGTAKSVQIQNKAELPEWCFVPQEPTIDKTAITAAIKAGEDVPGAALVESQHVRIK